MSRLLTKNLSRAQVVRLMRAAEEAVEEEQIARETLRSSRRGSMPTATRDLALVRFAIAGVRPAELARMTVGDLSDDSVRVTTHTPGHEVVERVELNQATVDWARRAAHETGVAGDSEAPLFPSRRGRGPMSTRAIWDAAKKLLKRSQLKDYSVEDLRRYYLASVIEDLGQEPGPFDLVRFAALGRFRSLAHALRCVEPELRGRTC
jgi:integrase